MATIGEKLRITERFVTWLRGLDNEAYIFVYDAIRMFFIFAFAFGASIGLFASAVGVTTAALSAKALMIYLQENYLIGLMFGPIAILSFIASVFMMTVSFDLIALGAWMVKERIDYE